MQSINKTKTEQTLRVLICGSRNWSDKRRIGKYLDTLIDNEGYAPENITIIHGACKGADYHAGNEAKGRGMTVEEYHADWKQGFSAGPKRNQRMLDEGEPHRVVAFHNDIQNSKGTYDMITRAKKANVPVEVITN